ncbi:hypothetical protein AAIR98_001718 [Elusimicrobium simillimum]|uniref:hypothetical protein n=1 Tax=Elusimicrobium simillimum TaxID=3143438 RepID=UPI003C6F18A7
MIRKYFVVNRRGQATTEVVLLLPLFLIFILFMSKIFALLVLVQKMEIAATYAARRWQLEAHPDEYYASGWDKNFLLKDIEKSVSEYIGFNNMATRNFLSLSTMKLDVKRTQVWNEIILTVHTRPVRAGILCNYNKHKICEDQRIRENCYRGFSYLCEAGGQLPPVRKFVSNRDRPNSFELNIRKRK